MSDSIQHFSSSTRLLLHVAKWLTLVGMVLFLGVILWGGGLIVTDAAKFDSILRETYLEGKGPMVFSTGQRWFFAFLMIASDFTGFIGLWLAWRLFSGYLRGNVFTIRAAGRLRLIGWMLVLLVPLTAVTDFVGMMVFSRWIDPQKVSLEISISDGDIFALVFGLLIVIVGHVMRQAILISEENKSFI